MKENAFVKLSGDVLANASIFSFLNELSQEYHVVVCVGGGSSINSAMAEMGVEPKFGPLGRETTSMRERQVQREVLERNQAELQDHLQMRGIVAEVIIPWVQCGSVSCPVNGDVYVQVAYLAFDVLFVFTLSERLENKRKQFAHLPKVVVLSV
jgi:acetylglutamate kinase